jgi:hypothetical protein
MKKREDITKLTPMSLDRERRAKENKHNNNNKQGKRNLLRYYK